MRFTPGRVAIGLAVVALGLTTGLLLALWSFSRGDCICKGVSVSGVAVGGMTRAEASGALDRWHKAHINRPVMLTALDARWKGTLADLDARADIPGSVESAFRVGRTGSLIERLRCVLTTDGKGKRITARLAVDKGKVAGAVAQVARGVDRPHTDAKLLVADGRLSVKPDSCGLRLNREKALAVVSKSIQSGLSVVPLPVDVDRPDVSAKDAATINTLLARYTTSFNPGKRDRTHNLTLASRAISGIILKPGDVFSANGSIGPREASRGFRNAIIFVRGKMEEGLGGGTCQVSSTLYNAVLLAGLEVVERAHHSRTVPYVPPGLDATLSYGIVDFRFKNSNPSPVGLVTAIKGSRLTVDIYGAAKDKKNIRVYVSNARHVAPGTKTVVDRTLAPGARKVLEPGSPGVSVTVYKETTGPDGRKTREMVSRNRYSVQPAIIAVGPPVRTAQAPGSSPAQAD